MKKSIKIYGDAIVEYTKNNYKKCFMEPVGHLEYKYIVPGNGYSHELWDWDSWLCDVALGEFIKDEDISEYQKGCVLNFLNFVDDNGWCPICLSKDNTSSKFIGGKKTNSHKPCLAQHALFVSDKIGDISWLKDSFYKLEKHIDFYENNCKHESGLYFWIDDFAIGVDNDPCTFYRPEKSSASLFLNLLMSKELQAMACLSQKVNGNGKKYENMANDLFISIQKELWDERDGFFYSADINLLPVNPEILIHSGAPRHWNTLIQRIGVWTGFMSLWAGVATKCQAKRIVKEHYYNKDTFGCDFGIRSLSKMEKMYSIVPSGNPSCWLGPVWIVSNWFLFEGLKNYGFIKEAKEICKKTITLLGKDIIENGCMHEYYNPETGEGVRNPGFQNWNLLALNMYKWLCEN